MDVIVKLVTKVQRFSVNTEDTDFSYTISNESGFTVTETDAGTEHRFKAVPPGEYKARVEKLGVFAEAFFTVVDDTPPQEGPDFDVPDSITVEVVATAPAPAAKASAKK